MVHERERKREKERERERETPFKKESFVSQNHNTFSSFAEFRNALSLDLDLLTVNQGVNLSEIYYGE